MSGLDISRTQWAERQVEELLSVPLVSEFVFRGPKHNDPTEKEVIDHLIIYNNQSILISQKAQEDPDKRDERRNALWVLKNIQDALKPICGAIRQPGERPKWCEHPRRGKVDFPSLPPIVHAIAIAETWKPVDLRSSEADLPLDYMDVPITYLSINDFLNLVMQLRSVPELLEYLKARRALSPATLRVVGDEKPLFELYLLNGGKFGSCTELPDAKRATAAHSDLVEQALARNADYQFFSGMLEHVADCLAVRDPNYAAGLPADALHLFDSDDNRKNYIMLQELLTGLRLRERAELGRAFHEVCERTRGQAQCLTFKAAHIDGIDRVFLFVSSKGWEKPRRLAVVTELAGGALAAYKKRDCFVIIDRDGQHYDLALTRPDYVPTPNDEAVGEKHFQPLKMATIDISQL
jgi:hypothetical protein